MCVCVMAVVVGRGAWPVDDHLQMQSVYAHVRCPPATCSFWHCFNRHVCLLVFCMLQGPDARHLAPCQP